MKITTKGQVTIPQEIRERYGFMPHTEVRFVPGPQGVSIQKSKLPGRQKSRGQEIVSLLAGAGNQRYTTDQLMRLTRGEP